MGDTPSHKLTGKKGQTDLSPLLSSISPLQFLTGPTGTFSVLSSPSKSPLTPALCWQGWGGKRRDGIESARDPSAPHLWAGSSSARQLPGGSEETPPPSVNLSILADLTSWQPPIFPDYRNSLLTKWSALKISSSQGQINLTLLTYKHSVETLDMSSSWTGPRFISVLIIKSLSVLSGLLPLCSCPA